MIDDVYKHIRAEVAKNIGGVSGFFGLVKVRPIAALIDQFYANARLAISNARAEGHMAGRVAAMNEVGKAYYQGQIDERKAITDAVDKDLNELQFFLLKEDVSAKELRDAYKNLLPRVFESLDTALHGERAWQENVQEVSEEEGSGSQSTPT